MSLDRGMPDAISISFANVLITRGRCVIDRSDEADDTYQCVPGIGKRNKIKD
jgi:hypothetical protein